jgi:hypothetical protein
MAGFTDYSADATLTTQLAGTRYVALHTGDPGATGANNEVGAGVGYAREAATFSGSGRSRSNDADVVFGPASGGGFGTVSHISIWDAASAGNCLWYGAADDSQAVALGVTGTLVAGDLVVSIP